MTLVDEAISSQSLLQLLEYLDRILEIYGTTRKNERVAATTLLHSFCPLGSICDPNYTKKKLKEIIVMRNVPLDAEIYNKVFGVPFRFGQKKTELDLFFLNVPTVVGHPTEGKLNFYVEIEMGEDIGAELHNEIKIRDYFEGKLDLYPILVCKQRVGWEKSYKIPVFNMEDLEKIAEFIPIKSIEDVPGAAYEWAATSLQILHYVARNKEVDRNKIINFRDGLWNTYPNLRQHNFRKLVETGTISSEDYEDFLDFRQRLMAIFNKMVEEGLLNKNEEGKYELSIDGRDILGCYLSFKEERE